MKAAIAALLEEEVPEYERVKAKVTPPWKNPGPRDAPHAARSPGLRRVHLAPGKYGDQEPGLWLRAFRIRLPAFLANSASLANQAPEGTWSPHLGPPRAAMRSARTLLRNPW